MSTIDAYPSTVDVLLNNQKYSVDPYQREYKWTTNNVLELIEDLVDAFEESFDENDERTKVRTEYDRYYLGSIIINRGATPSSIVDGQQRLTSITLLLIYLQNKIHNDADRNDLNPLIRARTSGQVSLNIQVEDREECLKNLLDGNFDVSYDEESASNLHDRFKDIQSNFPDFAEKKLVYFSDWIRYCVDFVKILTDSEERAYTIFETTNDRGLSLASSDMLKGYLISQIDNNELKHAVNDTWKIQIDKLRQVLGDSYSQFFREWLRAKYAVTSSTKRDSSGDYEQIGKSFHKWVRGKRNKLGLRDDAGIRNFVEIEFKSHTNQYAKLRKAAGRFEADLEYVYYNRWNSLTSQYPLILAALDPKEPPENSLAKIRAVSCFADIFVTYRGINHRRWAQSSIKSTMFNLMKEMRDSRFDDPEDFGQYLKDIINRQYSKPFHNFNRFSLRMNRSFIYYFLTRLTGFIEYELTKIGGMEGTYLSNRADIDVEHIIPDKFSTYEEEYETEQGFKEYRNRIGGLLLLPSSFNRSYGDLDYKPKREHYLGNNMLAQSLHEQSYERKIGIPKLIEKYGFSFEPYSCFGKDEIMKRQKLYKEIAHVIWDPDRILKAAEI